MCHRNASSLVPSRQSVIVYVLQDRCDNLAYAIRQVGDL